MHKVHYTLMQTTHCCSQYQQKQLVLPLPFLLLHTVYPQLHKQVIFFPLPSSFLLSYQYAKSKKRKQRLTTTKLKNSEQLSMLHSQASLPFCKFFTKIASDINSVRVPHICKTIGLMMTIGYTLLVEQCL